MLIAATAVTAEEAAATPPPAGDRAAHRQEIIACFDTDGDGKLSEAERLAAREAMPDRPKRRGEPGGLGGHPLRAPFMREYDADQDGKLDTEEKARAQVAWKEFVAKHDTDADGKLSREEARTAHQAWAAEHPEAAERMHKKADRDGDGTVSPAEKRAAAKELRKKRKQADAAPSAE